MLSGAKCGFCGCREKLLLCSRCKSVYYCNRDHQIKDWKNHKINCTTATQETKDTSDKPSTDCNESSTGITDPHKSRCEASSPGETVENICHRINSSSLADIKNSQEGNPNNECDVISNPSRSMEELDSPYESSQSLVQLSEISLDTTLNRTDMGILEDVCRNVIDDMNSYGVCVVDNFLGKFRGMGVLEEVKILHLKGKFEAGKLVTTSGRQNLTTIRSDEIVWVDGKDPSTKNIDMLITEVDKIIMRSNRMESNGLMGKFEINDRTKAMVACYPGDGAHYVKHVDNPNEDGRRITAIYYLNPEWNTKEDGGLLRIFPRSWRDKVADIEPVFDRMLFFWSDRRNPHEVQPSYRTRYAITLWYFDAEERKRYLARKQATRN